MKKKETASEGANRWSKNAKAWATYRFVFASFTLGNLSAARLRSLKLGQPVGAGSYSRLRLFHFVAESSEH
jgi:hypothetical protein